VALSGKRFSRIETRLPNVQSVAERFAAEWA
jgi:hypothetical protein